MNVISRKALNEYARKHADVRQPLLAWFYEAKAAHWRFPPDIKKSYPSATFLSGNRVVFNIKGNNYRLLVKVAYNTGVVFIKWAGTHAEYDKQKF